MTSDAYLSQNLEHDQQRTWSIQTSRTITLFFLFIIAGFIIAALVGAALTWDGSYYLFNALDTGTPFAPHGRLINSILQYPAIVLSQFTNNTGLLSFVFGFCYTLVPMSTLLSSWFVVRAQNSSLFIWIALGTTFAMLAGQFSLTSEALLVLHLTWPLAAMVVVPIRRFHAPLIIVFSLLLLVVHPTAIVLFAMLAGMAVVMGLRFPDQRRAKWLWAVGLLSLCGIAIARFLLTRTAYESDQLSLSRIEAAYSASIAGITQITTGLGLAAAIAIFAQPLLAKRPIVKRALYGLELLCLLVASVLLMLRATLPHLWTGTLDIRTWALFLSLPFFGGLFLEVISYTQQRLPLRNQEWAHRINSVLLLGIGFFGVMTAQSVSWHQLTSSLQAEMAKNPFSCTSLTSLAWIERTPLNHWSVTSYSMLIQGREPRSFVLGWDTCASSNFDKGVQITPWDAASLHGNGWFKLNQLNQRAIADSLPRDRCQLSLTKGWYWTENYGSSRWNWMAAQGDVLITADANQDVLLRGNVLAAGQANMLRIERDGVTQATIPVRAERAQSFEQRIRLRSGENHIALVSENPPIMVGADTRNLTVGFENLSLHQVDTNAVCLLRP